MKIKMRYTLRGHIDFLGDTPLENFLDKKAYFHFGPFRMEVPINGVSYEVPFEWGTYNVKRGPNGNITLLHGFSMWFNCDDELSSYYDGELQRLGLTREDLTPEVMSRATRIVEFHVDYEPKGGLENYTHYGNDELYIDDLCFIDENGKEFPVSKELLIKTGNILKL